MEIFGENLVLIEKVAAGGMGEIFLAKLLGKDGFEKTVAVKRIHPRIASDEEFKALFHNEVQLSAVLHHPNIIQAFGNGEIDGYLYLVMEFIDGCTLHRLVRKLHSVGKTVPVDLALLILAQACEGLAYAHELKDDNTGKAYNLIHRDLSPDNVMLSYMGMVKIVDFGVVKTANSQHTKTGTLKGKIAYMSPEQATGEVLDRRSDIFSLFAIFWESLAGERLFKPQKSEYELLKSVEKAVFPNLQEKTPHLKSEIVQMLKKGLARDRLLRYKNCDEVLKDIRAYLLKYHPETDRLKLSHYLQETFKEEILDQSQSRERHREEQEIFIQSARMHLETKLLSKSRLLQEFAAESDVDSSTKVSQIPSLLYKTKPEVKMVGINSKKLVLLGAMATLVGIFVTIILWDRFSVEDIPSKAVRTIASKVVTRPKLTELQSEYLPNLGLSKYQVEVNKLDEYGYKREIISPFGQKWKYWDAAAAPAADWMSPAFDDTKWKSGDAPLGYGDPMRTITSFGPDPKNKIMTQYFRREFQVKNLTRFNSFFIMGIRRDDGAIVYLNGKKVFSDLFKKTPVTHTTQATLLMGSDGGEESRFVYTALVKDNFVEGKNVVAVEVHQADATSTDLSMELVLLGWLAQR